MAADEEVTKKLDGLAPDWEKHRSSVIAEPVSHLYRIMEQFSLNVSSMKNKIIMLCDIVFYWMVIRI